MKIYKTLIISIVVLAAFCGCSSSSSSRVTFNVINPSDAIIASGTGEYYFPSVLKNTTVSALFTIENTSSTTLKLSGNPIVKVTSAGTLAFTVTEQPDALVKPNEKTTFKIEFAPTISQQFEATVEIANNSHNANPFKFTVRGIGLEPGLNVKQNSTYIPHNIGTFDFGGIRVNTPSTTITFNIENSATNDLNLTGSPKIILSGTDSAMFALDQTSVNSPITPLGSTTFTIIFTPISKGVKTAQISFENDDLNKNPYEFTITGSGVLPEINLNQNSKDLPSGSGVYDFGKIDVSKPSKDITFTIENIGDDKLNLTGSPKIDVLGNDATMFIVTQTKTSTSVAPADSTTFIIRFSPTSAGQKIATISIDSDDLDENPYTFEVRGTGVAAEINIRQNSIPIPYKTGVYDFGCVFTYQSSPDIIFTIENLGTADLKLTSAPKIEITGLNAFEFSITQTTTASTITPGNSTTFTIKFSPTSPGHKTATISIDNNDLDENPYVFAVKGTTTQFDFNGDGYEDVIIGAPYDDDGGSSSGCVFVFFGTNMPSTPLNASNADVIFIGIDVDDCFGKSVSSAGDVNGDGYDDLIVGATEDDDGGSNSGCAYLFFGSQSPFPKIEATKADMKLVGEDTRDFFGCSVDNLGDINNDGFDDIIVGAYGHDDGKADSGSAYIFYGNTNPTAIIDASNADVKIVGADVNLQFGINVRSGGDINADGFRDVIAVASQYNNSGKIVGCTYIFYGSSSYASLISSSNADVTIIGDGPNDLFGCSVCNAGDINDDGYDDILIGASGTDAGGLGSGSAFIFYGSSTLPQQLNSSNANIHIIGDNDGDSFGHSVSSAGDINRDGFDDMIISAVGDDDKGSNSGTTFIIFGNSNLSSTIYARHADVQITGEASHDNFGFSVSCAGDVNKDGYYDVIIGAIGADDGGSMSGNAYIIFGSATPMSQIDASSADIKIVGDNSSDEFGYCVSGGN